MNDRVIIAGGGPAGLMLACELGLAGVEAIVLEREAQEYADKKSPGTTLHARSVDLLERRGLMDEINADEPVIWPRIHYANIWIDLMPMIDEEYSIIVPQARTEQILAARALALGAEIRRGHAVVGLDQDDAGVTVRVSADGGEYDLRGRYLVGCDGGDSVVRSLAGIEAPPTGIPWYGVLADFEEIGEDWEWGSPTYPGGLFAVIPYPDGSGMLRVMTMEFGAEAPGDDVAPTADELRAAIPRITGKHFDLVGEPQWICRYASRTKLAAQYRNGNVFVAGDAAHIYYFGAGHGVNTSLHDAVNLGWKLAADIRGWAPDGLLDTYHAERHPAGRRACVSTMAQMALMHPHDQVAPLREVFEELMGFDNVERRLVGILTDVTYPMPSSGAGDDGEPHPLLGRPVPHTPITTADGETSTAAVLTAGRAVLIDFSEGAFDVDCAAGWHDRVDVLTARPTTEIDATALLIRPDGYVAWADSTSKDTEGLTEALTTWFGSPSA